MQEELDLRGYQCPLPVLKTRAKLRKMQPGNQVWVLTDDPLATIDIPAFCNESGQLLVEQVASGDGGGGGGVGNDHRFLIERQSNEL